MRNFFLLCLQLGFVAFTLCGVFAAINYFTGWHISFKGAEVPGDIAFAAVMIVVGAICGLCARIMMKKNEATEAKN